MKDAKASTKPPDIDDLVRRLQRIMQTSGWSLLRLSGEAGIHINTLRDFKRPGWNPRLDTIRKIERALLSSAPMVPWEKAFVRPLACDGGYHQEASRPK